MPETEQKTKRKQPRYSDQKCVRLNKDDIALIRNAYDHHVRRCGINRPDDNDDGGIFTENDWIVKTLRMGAKRELQRNVRDRER